MPARLRPFALEDYPAVLALWQAAGAGLQVRPSDTLSEVARKLERDPDLFVVAEADGRVAGVVMGAWDGRRGWIHHLAVAEGERRQGIGAALVGAVEDRLRARGCLKVNLLLRAPNEPARRLYERLGYSEMIGIVPFGKEL